MAFDGFVTKAIVSELNNCLINGKINKIFEPYKNEIIISIYSEGKSYALNVSIDSNYYRINLTTNSKPNPQNALNFCMVLRKHLIGGIIKKIYTNSFERIVFIEIDCHNELNDLITKTLVVELMGKHSNIILLNENKNVIDALRHLNKFDNSTRDIFPGSKYTDIVSNKLDFNKIKNFNDFYNSLKVSDNFSLSSSITKTFNGLGKNNVLHLLEYLQINDSSKSIEDLEKIYNYLKELSNILNSNFLYTNNKSIDIKLISEGKKDYFLCLSNEKYYEHLSINFFIDDFYYEKENNERFKAYRNNVLKIVLNQVTRIKNKIEVINAKIKECNNTNLYKLYGELITANLYRIPDFPQEKITLENYYDNNNLIEIPLDSTMTPSKNAKMYFKKYRKLQNTIGIVKKHKELAEEELKYLDSIVYEISSATNIIDIDNIYTEICDNLLAGQNTNTVNNHINNISSNKSTKENSSLLPTKYIIDGYTVLVGKNNKQNDYLTCKIAQNADIWFHTKDIHGCHVILKTNNESYNSSKLDITDINIPDSTLYKCACLAAYYSKARMSQNVPVDYTFVKYVKKPNGAKPGMVIYTNNKTIYANPQNFLH